MADFFSTGTARGSRDKYEVCSGLRNLTAKQARLKETVSGICFPEMWSGVEQWASMNHRQPVSAAVGTTSHGFREICLPTFSFTSETFSRELLSRTLLSQCLRQTVNILFLEMFPGNIIPTCVWHLGIFWPKYKKAVALLQIPWHWKTMNESMVDSAAFSQMEILWGGILDYNIACRDPSFKLML